MCDCFYRNRKVVLAIINFVVSFSLETLNKKQIVSFS